MQQQQQQQSVEEAGEELDTKAAERGQELTMKETETAEEVRAGAKGQRETGQHTVIWTLVF